MSERSEEDNGAVIDALRPHEAATKDQLCRYCLSSTLDPGDEFVSPCACAGGQQWVHLQCLRRWQRSVLVTQPTHPAFQLDDARTTHCGVCTQRFKYPPPSRLEMVMGFTGAELAALVQEGSLVCASESFSAEMRARLHSNASRASITNFVHWCRAMYFIYYAGPKRLVIGIPDEENRIAILDALTPSGGLQLRGRQYRILDDGPLANMLPGGRSFLATEENSGPRSRGAAWVQSAINGSRSDAQEGVNSDVSYIHAAISRLAIPAELTAEAVGSAEGDASDDTIRALNLGNRISPDDLSDDVKRIVQNSFHESAMPRNLLAAVDIHHHLGGPCATNQCVVLVPLGGEDGIIPPLPYGFKALPDLGIAIGTDLSLALRRLAAVREPCIEDHPRKRRRRFNVGVASEDHKERSANVAQNAPGEIQGQEDEDANDELERQWQLDEVSSSGSDVNAGEFIASAPSSSSSEDGDACTESTSVGDMVAGVAAEMMANAIEPILRPNAVDEPRELCSAKSPYRPLLVFWGEARWQRTQLLGELARGDWGLCQTMPTDLQGAPKLWQRIAVEEQRPVHAPPSEMTRTSVTDTSVTWNLRRLLALYQQASRQQGAEQ